MLDPNLDEYCNINSIIERDSTDATYKYALLRGTIEICEEYQHLGAVDSEKIWFPIGLLIEKWILYYYPIIANDRFMPQKSGETAEGSNHLRMSFRPLLTEVVEYYKKKGGGLSQFYNDYGRESIPDEISGTIKELCRKLLSTITEMPMKHLGYSRTQKPYSVFNYKKKEKYIPQGVPIGRDFLIKNFGMFSISTELNNVFQYFGGFISGEDTLLLKWANFSSEKSGGRISVAEAMEILQISPETERDTFDAQNFYKHLWDTKENIICIWTGKSINSIGEFHLDHILPFSAWKNNELWNLMPALPEVNGKKSDKIPSTQLLDSRKMVFFHYWNLMMEYNPVRFEKEIRISLIGSDFDSSRWQEQAFSSLKKKCQYLIDIHGFNMWEL